MNNSDSRFTNDPNYAAYYYSNSRLDPRLPPPSFYSPGQSWQMWPSSISSRVAIGGNFRQQRNSFLGDEEQEKEDQLRLQRKKLVDMIQEDFPRTPSPVHAFQPGQKATGIHLLGDHLNNSKPVKNGTKKPFSISGSVDAVMAAAIEAENDSELHFELEKLKLLPEEDEIEEVESWSQTIRIHQSATAVSVSNKSKSGSLEPFVYAAGNFVPFVPSIPTLNSAPARSSYNPQNFSVVAPGFSAQVVSLSSSPGNFNHPIYNDENIKMSIMEDFRMNRSKRYELFDLKGMMIDFSTDQHGSRFIQQKLETASEVEKEMVFAEIYPLSLQLMTDVFGNYVIQKFFEHGSKEQLVALAHAMHGHVLTLSLQMYGCRVVQKALEHVPSNEQICLVQELEGHVLRCVKDQNGNHVIQKCIECVPLKTSAPFLTASFLSQASALAMHPYGCRVIQRIFEHGPAEHSEALLDELLKNTNVLIQDQYGNYVIQHVLEHGKPSERTRIINFIQGKLLNYSRHKFASNVVEKCVSFGTEAERQELIDEILTPILAEDGSEGSVIPLHLMMKDQFANYVVQKMLEIVDGEQRDLLLNCIKPQLFQLRKYTYGKHILAKVEKMLGLTPSQPAEPAPINNHNNSYNNNVNYHHHQNQQYYPNSREYHSAPSSPVTKPHHLPMEQGVVNQMNNNNNHFVNHNGNYNGNYRRGGNQKIAKNDLNEFPPLNPRRR